MTKKEFEDYIDSFNKQPGDYTEDEIYKIGVAHKSLFHEDKSWNELVARLGLNKTAEALRSYIKRKQLDNNTLPKNMRELTSRTISEANEEELTENIDNRIAELYIQQTKTRDVANSYRRTLRDEARIEMMKDSIKSCVSELKELPCVKYSGKNVSTRNEAILLVSDLHIGVDCDNFYNKYNVEIAKKRVSKMVEDTIKYCKAFNINTLNIVNLGDLIHGVIHVSARVEQSDDVISQVMIASEILSEALNGLQEACPNVIYRSCSDNHARVIASKDEHIEKENLGRLIDWYVKERLKKSDVQFVNDNIDESLGKFKLLNGKNVMFAHGHLDNKNRSIQNYICATREFIDYICFGHYHNSSTKSYQGCKVFINGSVVGTEQYALSKRLFSEPTQKLIVFDNSNDNVVDVDINLNIN